MKAQFHLTDGMLDDIRAHIGKSDATYLPEFSVDITDSTGTTVARVSNTLRMRRKPDTRSRFGG